jgi:hypothetical protein
MSAFRPKRTCWRGVQNVCVSPKRVIGRGPQNPRQMTENDPNQPFAMDCTNVGSRIAKRPFNCLSQLGS